MTGVSYSLHFQPCCCRWTMLLMILTVLCSNLCFVSTVPIVPSTTFNTAQTTVTTATVANTSASLAPGSSSATIRNKVAPPSTSTVSSSTSTTSNGMSTLKPDHGKDTTSIALINNIQQTNKTNKPYVQETGSTLGANAALRTGTQTSTRSTLVPLSASTSTPTSTSVATKSKTTTTTRDSKAINVIHGAAALTSRKESRAQKINCKLLRKSPKASLISNGLKGDNHMSGCINVVLGEAGHYRISVEMGHVFLNGTDRRTVSCDFFPSEKNLG